MVCTVREVVGFAAFLVGAAALTAVNHHPDHGRRTERERAAVEAAAVGIPHVHIAEAWAEMKLGRPRPLEALTAGFPLPLRATREDAGGVVLTFDGHDETCIDLASRPDSRRVTARDC